MDLPCDCASDAEPAQGISELSGCLGPPWPPEGPQEKPTCLLFYFILIRDILCQWTVVIKRKRNIK